MRRIGLTLLVLAVVGGAAAGWWRWSRAPQDSSAGPAPTRPGATREAATRPVDALPVADLGLQVNGAAAAPVSAGTSVFFTVTLTGTAPEPALRIGSQGRPWPTNLRFETPEGTPFSSRLEQLGPPFTSRFGDDPIAQSPPTPQSDEAIVDASRIHRVEFGVSPDEAARIGAGTHSMRVVLTLDRNSSGLTQLVSNTVTFTVAEAPVDAQQSADAEKRRLESAARFYLRSAKWEDAHRIALQLAEQESADAATYQLLGDALNGLKRDEEALAAYNEALAALDKTIDESPDYLIARMDEVQHRLEASKGKKE